MTLSEISIPLMKVGLNMLKLTPQVPVDLYLQLSAMKYVKVYNNEEQSLDGVVNKFENKYITELYCERKDYQKLTNYLFDNGAKVDQANKVEFIRELTTKLGVSESVSNHIQSIGNENINHIKKDKSFPKHFKEVLEAGDYLGQHAVMVSFMSCLLAREMGWNTPTQYNKLSFAGILHDITLTENILLGLKRDSDEINFENSVSFLNWDEQNTYGNHVNAVNSILEKSKNIPEGVCDIIADHHEVSFEKLSSNRKAVHLIPQINALFIIADQFCHMVHSEAGIELDEFLSNWNRFEEVYNKGNFRKPLECLKGILFSEKVTS